MICYPENVSDEEILVINDYWRLTEDLTGFVHTVKEVDSIHASTGAYPASKVAHKSRYLLNHPAFYCHNCRETSPARSRKDYNNRIKSAEPHVCDDCIALDRKQKLDKARSLLDSFKYETFRARPYLDELTVPETFALFTLTASMTDNDHFLGKDPSELYLTGVRSVDQRISMSLLKKQVLVYLPEIPIEIEQANRLLFSSYVNLKYFNRDRHDNQYRNPGSISPGVYLISPALDETPDIASIAAILYQKLDAASYSIKDISMVKQLIEEVQIDKIYELIEAVSIEYDIPIDNSQPLRSLLSHLAEYYPPQNLYYTLRYQGLKTAAQLHKDRPPGYIAKHYFTKFLTRYIRYIEDKGVSLIKTWNLPLSVETSPFEALFSELYLKGHFDWSRLSVKDIVGHWMQSVNVKEEAAQMLRLESE